MKLLALCGSLRARSVNHALLEAAELLAPSTDQFSRYTGLRSLPHFDPDLDTSGSLPREVVDLRARVAEADALLVACPEYAHGVPGAFKNALDWLVGGPEMADKVVALFSAAPRAFRVRARLVDTLSTMAARVHPAASLELRLQNPQATASELVADPEVASRIRGALAALREPLAETNGFAELLQDFPEFLRSECTRIESGERFDRGAAEGHAFESLAGSQIVLWSASEGGERALDHVHDFDEYVVVVAGQYTVHQGGTSVLLRPGDELLLPAGVPHSGQALPGTRTLHAYGGKRFALRGKP